MPFDNYVVGAVSRELNQVLSGGRVERVYQPEREEILLCVNRPPMEGRLPGRYNLLISASAARPLIHLAERREAGPQNPPAFCMLLRKYLIGAHIERIFAVERERIVHLDFLISSELGLKEKRTLIFELMGKHSNLIFLNGGRIVDAIKRVSPDMSRVRQTLPGMEYTPPPPGKGLSPVMAEELGAEKDPAHFDTLAQQGDYQPTIWRDGERAVDFHVFQLELYSGLEKLLFHGETALSEMLETWYESRETQSRRAAKANELGSALKTRIGKLGLKAQRLQEEVADAARADELRKTGDLITANIWHIEKGLSRVWLEDYEQDGISREVELDPLRTPAQNAQRYYKLYSKAKTAAIVKAKQLEATQEQLDYLESVLHFLSEAGSAPEIEALRTELAEAGYIRQRKGAARTPKNKHGRTGLFAPIEYALSSGARLFVGRNNAENDELTLRFAAKNDFWLHTKNIPGSHVILKPTGTEPSEQELRYAAETAAWHSKARNSEGVPVDYTLVRHVKKPSGARPGYVIFTHNHTLYVTPRRPE